MKKIIVAALLLAAAGSVLYYYKQFYKINSPQLSREELIIGNWSFDSVSVNKNDSLGPLMAGIILSINSNHLHYQFHFGKDGKVLKSLPGKDSDTSAYEWKDSKTLYWKEALQDSTGEYLQLLLLDDSRLVLQSKDSVSAFFSKAQ